MATPGRTNFAVGWTGILIGLGMGMVLGLWSFDGPVPAPAALAEYGATPRRLLRLSHIAWVALGLMNVVLGLSAARLARSDPAPAPGSLRLALHAMNFGALGLPLCLLVAAFVPPAKYLMALPASCVVCTAAVMAGIGWRLRRLDGPDSHSTRGVES